MAWGETIDEQHVQASSYGPYHNEVPPTAHPLDNTFRTNQDVASPPPTAVPEPMGIVTGIVYSSDKPSATVRTNWGVRVVYEGDIINGVTIIKIERGSVHFEANGKEWSQRTGETPPPYLE